MRKLIFSHSFPTNSYVIGRFINTVTLGIGGNIGNCTKRFECLYQWFKKNRNLKILGSSPIYINPPFGYLDQQNYYNATLTLSTCLSLTRFFSLIFYLERRFGRPKQRSFKNSPRTLDIDIIFFNNLVLNQSYLRVPHLKWSQRESVLIPLFLQYLISRNF